MLKERKGGADFHLLLPPTKCMYCVYVVHCTETERYCQSFRKLTALNVEREKRGYQQWTRPWKGIRKRRCTVLKRVGYLGQRPLGKSFPSKRKMRQKAFGIRSRICGKRCQVPVSGGRPSKPRKSAKLKGSGNGAGSQGRKLLIPNIAFRRRAPMALYL